MALGLCPLNVRKGFAFPAVATKSGRLRLGKFRNLTFNTVAQKVLICIDLPLLPFCVD